MCKSLSERRIQAHGPAPVGRDHHGASARASASAKRSVGAIAAQAGRLATSHHNRNAPAWSGRFFAAQECQFRKGREQSGGIGGRVGQPEIDQAGEVIAGEQDVGRFDVAVQQAPLVGVVECPGHRGDDGAHVVYRHPVLILGFHQLSRIGALDVVHRNPQLILEVASVVHADDMRMKQRGAQVGFAVKPAPEFGIRRHVGRQDLERVAPRQPWVLSKIYLGHASGPEQPNNGVPGEHLTATQRHGRILQTRSCEAGPVAEIRS